MFRDFHALQERGEDGELMKTMDRRSLGFARLEIRGTGQPKEGVLRFQEYERLLVRGVFSLFSARP